MAVLWLWFLSSFSSIFSFSSQLCNECFPCFTSPAFQTARAPVHAHTQIDVFPIFTFSSPPLSILKYIYLACVLEHTNDLCLFPSSCCWQWLRSTAPASSVEQVSSGAFHCCSEIWITNTSLWNLLSPVHRAMGSRVCFIFYYFIHILSFLSSKGASHNAGGGSIS